MKQAYVYELLCIFDVATTIDIFVKSGSSSDSTEFHCDMRKISIDL